MKHAKEEGVRFLTLHNPLEYEGDEKGNVCLMRLQRMELGEPDESGRRSPVAVDGAVEDVPVDLVIVSVGVSPNPLIPNAIPELEVSRRGTIVVDESTMRSSLPDIYAGGDIVRGGATVILAMATDAPRQRWTKVCRTNNTKKYGQLQDYGYRIDVGHIA